MPPRASIVLRLTPILPFLAAIGVSEPVSKNGLTVYPSDEHPELTAMAQSQVPGFRDEIQALLPAKDFLSQAAEPDVKAELIKKLSSRFFLPEGDSKTLSQCYDEALAHGNKQLLALEFAVKRVYIYDGLAAFQKMSKGIPQPGLTIKGNGIQFDWNEAENIENHAALDFPVLLIVSPDDKTDDAWVKKELTELNHLVFLKELNSQYSIAGYKFMSTFVESVLEKELGATPAWLRAGITHTTSLKLLADVVGTKSSQKGYFAVVQRPEKFPSKDEIDLFTWDPSKHSPKENGVYVVAAVDFVDRMTTKFGDKWTGRMISRLKKAEKIGNPEAAAAAKAVGGIDVTEYMPPNMDI